MAFYVYMYLGNLHFCQLSYFAHRLFPAFAHIQSINIEITLCFIYLAKIKEVFND